MSRSALRPWFVFLLLVMMLTVVVLTLSAVQTRNQEQRATAEMLGTQAVNIVCATYTARGESPPQCQSK